ncbi:DUF1207 domain-containing protein [Melioribacter sp. Ez-97]|uniref:DUF1207 domain-containing protein n=1 Tax=Melioribacter sp. Ez-97 TaxID=3423434 RepID=UPI003EDA3071
MKKFIPVILFVLINVSSKAQGGFQLFPSELSVQPFTANILEPKLGFLFHTSNNELRLDIGNSVDIIRWGGGSEYFSVGADLFTYTLLRSESDFHFPVDAVDYLFGLNASWKVRQGFDSYGIRFRLSHISAHFVDGHYDWETNDWRDGKKPRVYSREFVELIPFYQIESLRVYAGFTYLFHVDPEYIGKDIYQFGFDYFYDGFFKTNLYPFLAYDFKLQHIGKYSATHNIMAGLKFGKSGGRGISLYFNYFSGNNFHGEYFDTKENYFSIGFNLDL